MNTFNFFGADSLLIEVKGAIGDGPAETAATMALDPRINPLPFLAEIHRKPSQIILVSIGKRPDNTICPVKHRTGADEVFLRQQTSQRSKHSRVACLQRFLPGAGGVALQGAGRKTAGYPQSVSGPRG